MTRPRPKSAGAGAADAPNDTPAVFRPARIISGGQTGVDRGALDAAIRLEIPHGGACPRGRLAEDGRIPDRYELTELASDDYRVRTEQNVIAAHATLILCRGPVKGGTSLTRRFARQYQRPHLVVDPSRPDAEQLVRRWLAEVAPVVLNVAGPRESNSPGAAAEACEFLCRVLRSAS